MKFIEIFKKDGFEEKMDTKNTLDRFQKLDYLSMICFEEKEWHLLTAWS